MSTGKIDALVTIIVIIIGVVFLVTVAIISGAYSQSERDISSYEDLMIAARCLVPETDYRTIVAIENFNRKIADYKVASKSTSLLDDWITDDRWADGYYQPIIMKKCDGTVIDTKQK